VIAPDPRRPLSSIRGVAALPIQASLADLAGCHLEIARDVTVAALDRLTSGGKALGWAVGGAPIEVLNGWQGQLDLEVVQFAVAGLVLSWSEALALVDQALDHADGVRCSDGEGCSDCNDGDTNGGHEYAAELRERHFGIGGAL
jgi:hypothetical protein